VLVSSASREKAERDDTVVDVSQMENLWDAHSMCLTLLQCQLMRTLRLVRQFPIANCAYASSSVKCVASGSVLRILCKRAHGERKPLPTPQISNSHVSELYQFFSCVRQVAHCI